MGADRWDVSCCGLNCAKCKTLENQDCGGCRGDQALHHTPDCVFTTCAAERGHDYCFECVEFPCAQIDRFATDGHQHHQLAVEHLKRMKEIGIEKWKEEQPQVMFCPGWLF